MAREKSKDHELSACPESKIVDCAAKVHSACSGTEWISYGHLVATGLAGAAGAVASAGAGGTVARRHFDGLWVVGFGV